MPCGRIRRCARSCRRTERERLGRVVYQGIVCASLLLRRPLAEYYITNITEAVGPLHRGHRDDRPGGPAANSAGNALVYLPRYLAQDDPFW